MDINEVLKILKANGYKSTEQRKEIIRSIINKNRYVSAKEILNQVQRRFSSVSFDTIYRNLAILSELDLIEVRKQDGESKFKISCTDDHHHHIICNNCGKIYILPECPMELLKECNEDFKITGHKFEIYGICSECQNA
ncbi:transcriptional repressor [Vulcanibacillus modesticaldus]|uniref:Transcriptional repressor n=1 Tax=Vulcanibacillus modesticaldus TaxID=337097 RepID=A0A1D2YWH8_9BACI|nr:Fur family transcriptional regulator [Vulcanibacillus modesticaldus]OEG00008.1 transcriptional repressor [Vulcanibacillus modesticaldus]